MPVTVSSVALAGSNGDANDIVPVQTAIATLSTNDSNLKTEVDTLMAGDIEDSSTLTLNAAHTGSPTANGNFEVERGSSANVRIRWNETTDEWEITADGTNYVALTGTPTGTIQAYSASTAPTGWLLCDGTAVSRTTYASLNTLYSADSYPYGNGDGSTTFNLPDLRGRVVLGKDDMGGVAANRVTSSSTNGTNSTTLGGAGGAETHTITVSEMPAHNHSYTRDGYNIINVSSGGTGIYGNSTGAFNTTSAGSGGAHSNTQPWIALNYIVKT